MTSLMLAASHGHDSVVNLLARHGRVDVNIQNQVHTIHVDIGYWWRGCTHPDCLTKYWTWLVSRWNY